MKAAFILRETKKGITVNFRPPKGKWLFKPMTYTSLDCAKKDIKRLRNFTRDMCMILNWCNRYWLSIEIEKKGRCFYLCEGVRHKTPEDVKSDFKLLGKYVSNAEISVYK